MHKLLPFYLVIDVSCSMDGQALEQADQYLPVLADALLENPILADKVRFCVVDFAEDARVVLPLCDLAVQHHLPAVRCRGTTASYVAVLKMLRERIGHDVRLLQGDGFEVFRPVVFFISDGRPGEQGSRWRAALAALTHYDPATGVGNRWYPNIVPFGVGDANRDVLDELVHPSDRSRLFLQPATTQPGPALSRIAEILTATTLDSGTHGELTLPDTDTQPQPHTRSNHTPTTTADQPCAQRQQTARNLMNQAARLDDPKQAIALYDQVIDLFGDDPDPTLREQVAKALVDKGFVLNRLGRYEQAISTCDRVIERFGNDPAPALREPVAMALRNKGFALNWFGRYEQAISTFDRLIERFGDDPAPALREQVAMAMRNKGVALNWLGRYGQAISTLNWLIERFGDDPAPAVRKQVSFALHSRDFARNELGAKLESSWRRTRPG